MDSAVSATAAPSASLSTSPTYETTLAAALDQFRTLLASHASKSWKPLPPVLDSLTSSAQSHGKGKAKDSFSNGIAPLVDPANDIVVHRRAGKGADVYRAVVEVTVKQGVDLDNFKAVLQTEAVRGAWDKLVERATSIELMDSQTRITKTDYRLGWPASPRDTITISKTFSDPHTLIDISTSLPRSHDSPAFLNPAPPYLRSDCLIAWSIRVPPTPTTTAPLAPSTSASVTAHTPHKARITLFWQWNLKGALFTTQHRQIATLLTDFIEFVRARGDHLPLVSGFGKSLQMNNAVFDPSQDTLQVQYTLVEEEVETSPVGVVRGVDELDRQKERRRLERAIEFSLSAAQGWDIKVQVKGLANPVEMVWTSTAEAAAPGGRITLRLSHAPLLPEQIFRVHVSIQRVAGSKLFKINGEVKEIVVPEPRNLSVRLARDMLDDTASITHTSLADSALSDTPTTVTLATVPSPSTSAIDSLLRRSYIYFTSLLQEPEAKWRPISDSQGVTVTQLNSIDPTLTIYRAEATFVGVGVWDVFSTICSPGARAQWDKTMEDAVLLEDVNELSTLWYIKTKAAWPAVARDSVTIRTAYKSPTSVHIFSFSTDDTHLFPSIPPVVLPTIRTQTDLYGWAIEALSPTTTQITLLVQSDPKGWSSKSWTPAQMTSAAAGVRDFSIKFGGPPVVTRLQGAKATLSKYDHEKGTLKLEYKAAVILPSAAAFTPDDLEASPALPILAPPPISSDSTIECEIRCDCSIWAASLDIIIDPPPSKVSCLSRHRLSSGGGLWPTIEHDSIMVADERILVLIRKGSASKEKGSVTINGARAVVDVESLPDDEVKLLSKRKRVKASPIPLDQYSSHVPRIGRSPSPVPLPPTSTSLVANAPPHLGPADAPSPPAVPHAITTPSPLVLELSASVDSIAEPVRPKSTAPLLPPAQALEALAWLQAFHAEQGPDLSDPAPGWTTVSERTGTVVRKKLIPRISEALYVYRGDKIVQGLSADEIANIVSSVGCRPVWDERVESATALTAYGHGVSTSVMTTKPVFPFKGRVFHVASVNAQVRVPSASSAGSSTVIFIAAASYTPDETFDNSKLNPGRLLPGAILIEGWILETLDRYTSSILAIPSTRCTHVTCVDHSGSVPFALNSVLNGNLAKIIAGVENLGKTKGPLPSLQTPCRGLQIEGPLSDEDGQDCVWRLADVGKDSSVLLASDFAVEDGTFRSLYKLLPQRSAGPGVAGNGGGTMLKSELPRSVSLTFSSLGAPPTLQVPSTATNLLRKPSSSSLRAGLLSDSKTKSTSSSDAAAAAGLLAPVTATVTSDARALVAELIVDLRQFPYGYSIITASALLPASSLVPLSLEPLTLAQKDICLTATVHDAPLPPIVSASLDASKRKNHLVRILVAAAPATASALNDLDDPLRAMQVNGPREIKGDDWQRKLVERGALVDVRIIPLLAPVVDKAAKVGVSSPGEVAVRRVTFNGEHIVVASQKDSRAVLGNMEDEDWYPCGARISRVTRKRKSSSHVNLDSSSLPVEFQSALAVAVRLLAPQVDSPTADYEFPDPKSPGSVTPEMRSPLLDPASRRSSASRVVASEPTSSLPAVGGPLLAILGSYPLSRLSSSIMSSSAVGPAGPTSLVSRRTYSLGFILVVGLIAFLFGSLLRSLLAPADYIIYDQRETIAGGGGDQVERALVRAFDASSRNLREARRLLETPLWFGGYDIILVKRS